MNTVFVNVTEIERKWHVIDASDRTLGRLCTEVASILYGKNKVIYSPSQDTGDYVVVINASKVRVTGNKAETKHYFWNSGYPGGNKSISLRDALVVQPVWVIEHAVKGMLPHNRLGRAMFKKLKVYAGPEHPHGSQVAGAPAPAEAK